MTVDAKQKINQPYWNGLSECRKITRQHELELFGIIAFEALCKTLGVSRASHKVAAQDAVDQLMRSQMCYVVRQAQRFWRPGLDINDIIQDGNMGLLRAIKEYDPSRGNRLGTMAHHWIRNYMQRGEEVIGAFVKVSLSTRRRHMASLSPAAQRLVYGAHKSLDDTICGQDGNMLPVAETVPGNEPEPHERILGYESRGDIANNAKAMLREISEPHGADVVMRRLNGEKLAAIGKSLGVCKERVRQIEEKAWIQLLGLIDKKLIQRKLKRKKRNRRKPLQKRRPRQLSVA